MRLPCRPALDRRDGLVRVVAVRAVGDDHVDALAGELERGRAADAAVGAGDQCDT
jgi:hypothetical protein